MIWGMPSNKKLCIDVAEKTIPKLLNHAHKLILVSLE